MPGTVLGTVTITVNKPDYLLLSQSMHPDKRYIINKEASAQIKINVLSSMKKKAGLHDKA